MRKERRRLPKGPFFAPHAEGSKSFLVVPIYTDKALGSGGGGSADGHGEKSREKPILGARVRIFFFRRTRLLGPDVSSLQRGARALTLEQLDRASSRDREINRITGKVEGEHRTPPLSALGNHVEGRNVEMFTGKKTSKI